MSVSPTRIALCDHACARSAFEMPLALDSTAPASTYARRMCMRAATRSPARKRSSDTHRHEIGIRAADPCATRVRANVASAWMQRSPQCAARHGSTPQRFFTEERSLVRCPWRQTGAEDSSDVHATPCSCLVERNLCQGRTCLRLGSGPDQDAPQSVSMRTQYRPNPEHRHEKRPEAQRTRRDPCPGTDQRPRYQEMGGARPYGRSEQHLATGPWRTRCSCRIPAIGVMQGDSDHSGGECSSH